MIHHILYHLYVILLFIYDCLKYVELTILLINHKVTCNFYCICKSEYFLDTFDRLNGKAMQHNCSIFTMLGNRITVIHSIADAQ